MLKKSVFFTVVYPKALPYFEDVCESALNQTNSDFDFLVVNDGCDSIVLKKLLTGLDYTILNAVGSPSENRQQGINFARTFGYQYILFCDADDTFVPKRHKKTILEFEQTGADIIVSNLNVVDVNLKPIIKDYFSKELPDNQWIDGDFIKEKNIFGMSNTALRLDKLKNNVAIPETPIADWLLFSILLNKGLKAKYINDSLVNYRQYENNLIGINRFDLDSFKRLAKLKYNHYKLLVDCGFSQYKKLLSDTEELLFFSDKSIEKIINSQMLIHEQPLWWQIISKV